MKFSVGREDLLGVLGHANAVSVNKTSGVTILGYVLMRVGQSSLSITATDLEITLKEALPLQGAEPGVAVVHAQTLYEIVRRQPAGKEISFSVNSTDEKAKVSVRCGRFATQLVTMDVDEFPDTKTASFTHRFKMPAAEFVSLLTRTRPSISTEETRYYLNGVYIHVSESDDGLLLNAVSTDGHRLTHVYVTAPEGAVLNMPGAIVPKKTVGEIIRLFGEREDEVTIGVSETRIEVSAGDVLLVSKIIDGTFPDYRKVIPQNADREVKLSRGAFSSAIGRVAVLGDSRSRAVKVEISDGSVTLSCLSADAGSATETLDGSDVEAVGSSLETGFQARYLGDILDTIDTQDVVMRFKDSDPSAPIIIQGYGDDPGTYVVMPTRC